MEEAGHGSWKWCGTKGAKFLTFYSSKKVNFHTKKAAPFAKVRVWKLKIGTFAHLC